MLVALIEFIFIVFCECSNNQGITVAKERKIVPIFKKLIFLHYLTSIQKDFKHGGDDGDNEIGSGDQTMEYFAVSCYAHMTTIEYTGIWKGASILVAYERDSDVFNYLSHKYSNGGHCKSAAICT